MNAYEIVPLAMGVFRNYEKSWLLCNTCPGEKTDALITSFLIRGNGHNVLVDTGCSDPETAAEHYHAPMEQPAEMELIQALKNVGLTAADIDCVVHTHLHWDHCYHDDLFPHCKIYVQKKELQYAISPLPCQWDEYETAHAGHSYPWLKQLSQFELVDGDVEILPGIRLIYLPGHSRGFQGVLVDTAIGKQLIAGESVPVYENWLGVKGKKFLPSGIHVNTRDCLESFSKMAEISDYIWAGNDMRVMERVCIRVGKEGGAESELANV